MKRGLQLLGSVAALLASLYFLRWNQLTAAAARIDLLTFLLALILSLISLAVLGFRWIAIVRSLAPAPLTEQWRIYFIATFLNSFTPANLGGDIYRAVKLRPWARRRSTAALVAALGVERVVGLCSYFAGYLLALGLQVLRSPQATLGMNRAFILPALPVAAALVTIVSLPRLWRHRRLLRPFRMLDRVFGRHLRDFYRGLLLSTRSKVAVLALLSSLAWAAWVAATAVVSTRLGLNISLPLLAMIVTLTELARLIPVSFQGVGIREGVFSALVGLGGGSLEIGFMVAAITYAALSLALLLSGVIGWILGIARPEVAT